MKYLTKYFFPSYETGENWPFRGVSSNVMFFDYGINTRHIRLDYVGGATVVCRAVNPPSVSGAGGSTYKKVFVPLDSVDSYKAHSNWSSGSSVIYAIGGSEWVADYGSADEYADYDFYGVPHP